jgi:uncharacterized protein YqeY
MPGMSLKEQIQSDMKTALRAGEKELLSVIRMLLAAIQMREIDTRETMSDADVLQVVEKLIKQRKDAAKQYADADRPDREAQELGEAEMLMAYMPEQLSEAELITMVDEIMAATGASSMKDMGAVMGQLKARVQGRADMGSLSAIIKARLAG